ncbi:hypothetical protein SAMN05421738_10796 [Algoriella xinjiangensis]|uniref:TonB protein C-terminal n=1 Tax=Algoriella xinjiangensis TaxID=684065 RepID=A0A1I4WN84_9FLAO|nr:hypothetical protein [Algoriella xinjiangensis]SFN14985.1 hypothetical protein SAMN05421738_10796 [Algoriella xinjiangensis]VDH16790.1 Uncharacterised protein [Algoriella xinjiangensis]
MKKFAFLLLLSICNLCFSQETYNVKTVDQFAIYPTCKDSIDKFAECFDQKLNEDLQTKLSKIKLDKILKTQGEYFAKLNFVVDEEGNFTNIRISGNDVLGRISKEVLLKINNEQIDNETKISPALLNGNPVKINYAVPVKYVIK